MIRGMCSCEWPMVEKRLRRFKRVDSLNLNSALDPGEGRLRAICSVDRGHQEGGSKDAHEDDPAMTDLDRDRQLTKLVSKASKHSVT
jgi:hypothetical protein